jgi:hypothetical protein
MRRQEQVLAYARQQADELEKDMSWQPSEHARGGGYWKADSVALSRIAARATAALEFFRQYAGNGSFWTSQATQIFQSGGNNQSMETGARTLGDLLRAWADQVEAGVTEIVGSHAWAEVGTVSTDMMNQVRRLNQDRDSHPAAAIVLCGAALEVALRAVAEAQDLAPTGRPSIGAYADLLRQAELITAQQRKDFESCAGLRNAAAHGHFGELSRERAGLMEQQTNLLLGVLTDLQPDSG